MNLSYIDFNLTSLSYYDSHYFKQTDLPIWLLFKDAGFVYESLQNETNRVIWEKNFHETNPRNRYFKKISTNPNHDTGSLKLSLRNESTKRIFKVRIRESASLDS